MVGVAAEALCALNSINNEYTASARKIIKLSIAMLFALTALRQPQDRSGDAKHHPNNV